MAETLADFTARLEALSLRRGTGSLHAAIRKKLLVAGLRMEADAKKNATRRPRVRSGLLRNSIRHQIVERADGGMSLILQAGNRSSVRYARIQEEGGVIRAKKSRFLAIPMSNAKTAAGVPRWPTPRAVPGLFAINLGGRVFLVRKRGEGLEFLYRLKESVRIRATKYLARAVARQQKRLPRELIELTIEAIEGDA